MFLTPEVIEHCKKELQIQNDFEASDKPTANHELFEQWRQKTKRTGLPKMIFYILLDEIYGPSYVKDDKENLGRLLRVKSE